MIPVVLLLLLVFGRKRWVKVTCKPPPFPIVNTSALGMRHDPDRDNVGHFVRELRERHNSKQWYRWELHD